MRNILVTGISGQIGKSLLPSLENLFSSGDSVDLLKHKTEITLPFYQSSLKLNITDTLKDYDLCLHMGANTDTRYCQKDPAQAREINVGLTKRVCNCSNKVILLSTDYVFNGDLLPGESYSEDDEVNPFNAYGETKVESERIVLENNGAVIRIETMMGVPNKIVDATRKAISGEDYYPPYRNFYIRPAYFGDLLNLFENVISNDSSGIYHASCSGDALSRAEMANIVFQTYKEKGWRTEIDELKTEDFKEEKRFALGTKKARSEFGMSFIDGKKAIKLHTLSQI